jgi:hypothetical protein
MNAQPDRRDRHLRRRMPPRRWLLASALALVVCGPALADSVIDWNIVANAVAPRMTGLQREGSLLPIPGPQPQSRGLTMVHLAIHDALNAIDPRYQTYLPRSPASPDASPDAAVAAAAYNVLLTWIPGDAPLTLPSGVTTLDTVYAAAIAALPDAGKADGIAAGAAAAAAILQHRTGDGSTGIDPVYTTAPGPGVYQPTPAPEFPAQIIPSFAAWAAVTPFAIRSASQFRADPGEIFDLGGAAYTREYNEVMSIGDARVRGAAPDSEESDIARYWGAAGGADWNANARVIVNGLGLDQWQHARLFALVNMSNADALIANQDSKYLYRFWRPVTAIRWADDGNPATPSDPGWRPLLQTPPYPDYPCALPTGAGAGAEALRRFFGTDNVAYTRSVTAPVVALPPPMAALPAKPMTRHFDSLSEAVEEAASSRVYAGIHFRSGCYAGARMGRQVAHFVYRHYLKPMKARPLPARHSMATSSNMKSSLQRIAPPAAPARRK